MATTERPSSREAKRLQTRERLMGAAIAEFKRSGMVDADVGAIVSAAGVAHGTFFFHFPTKEHVLLELERREEVRISRRLREFAAQHDRLGEVFGEAVRLVSSLERRLGSHLFKDFLALHFSPTRPPVEDGDDHPVVVAVADQIARSVDSGESDPDVNPMNSAVFFLLGLYALLTTTHGWPTQAELLEDYVLRTLRSVHCARPAP